MWETCLSYTRMNADEWITWAKRNLTLNVCVGGESDFEFRFYICAGIPPFPLISCRGRRVPREKSKSRGDGYGRGTSGAGGGGGRESRQPSGLQISQPVLWKDSWCRGNVPVSISGFVVAPLSCDMHIACSDGKMVVCYLCEQLGPESLMWALVSEWKPAHHLPKTKPHPDSGSVCFHLTFPLAHQCWGISLSWLLATCINVYVYVCMYLL